MSMNNSAERLLESILKLYEDNRHEISMIECLSLLIEETDLTEEDVISIIDDNIKIILKENSAQHNMFRKSFYKKQINILDI